MSFSPPYSYIKADDFAALWKSHQTNRVAVVDVRDDDFEGGHIKGCIHVPSTVFQDKVEDLVTGPLKSAAQVVFHCSLSQARGPKAARIYRETRDQAIADGKIPEAKQTVSVLRDGFSEFGSRYKNDASLVEDYDEESWKYR